MDLQTFLENEWSIIWFKWICDKPNISWVGISLNPNITNEIIEKYGKFYPFEMGCVNHILQMKNPIDVSKLCDSAYCNIASQNPHLSLAIIEKWIHCDWNWHHLSKHPIITMKFVKKYADKPWNWVVISSHKNITMDDVMQNPDLPWNWSEITRNSNVTMEMIKNNPDLKWDLKQVGKNPNITMEFINQHSFNNFNWDDISQNPNITMSDIANNPHGLWNHLILHNPNFTCNIQCTPLDRILKDTRRYWSLHLNDEINPNMCMSDFTIKSHHFNILGDVTFSREKQRYVTHHTKSILLLHIFTQYLANPHYVTNIDVGEFIIYNDYLLKKIIGY
jgi:hypothetical protein